MEVGMNVHGFFFERFSHATSRPIFLNYMCKWLEHKLFVSRPERRKGWNLRFGS